MKVQSNPPLIPLKDTHNERPDPILPGRDDPRNPGQEVSVRCGGVLYPAYALSMVLLTLIVKTGFFSLAYGDIVSPAQYCTKSSMKNMLEEIEALHQSLKDKSGPPVIDNKGPPFIDVTELAKKYIHVGCEVADVKTNLTHIGFKLTDYESLTPPLFDARILLKKEWWQLISVELRIEVEYSSGRIRSVQATIFYLSL